MGKGASIPITATSFLVVSKMDGDMVIFFVSTSKGQGLCSLLSFFLSLILFSSFSIFVSASNKFQYDDS